MSSSEALVGVDLKQPDGDRPLRSPPPIGVVISANKRIAGPPAGQPGPANLTHRPTVAGRTRVGITQRAAGIMMGRFHSYLGHLNMLAGPVLA